VLRLNGTTDSVINSMFASVDDAAGLAFGPTGNLFVVSSRDAGALTVLNGTAGAFIGVFASATGACSALALPRDLTFGPKW